MNIQEGTLLQQHEALKAGKISVMELTQSTIASLSKSETNAFIMKTPELALYQATKLDSEIASGAKSFQSGSEEQYLLGIPYNLKDLFITEGIRTTAGSKILANYIPPYQGHVAGKLQAAGGILIGKTNLDEFGMGSTNENSPFGAVLNPLDKTRVAGGSSGGSCASVAESTSTYSIGTDTGGSIRMPSHYCGVTGIKPTYGRISRFGQIAYASSLDQSAPVAKTALDLTIILKYLTGQCHLDATSLKLPPLDLVDKIKQLPADYLKGKKIGFIPEWLGGIDNEIKHAFNGVMEYFSRCGADLIEVKFPHAKYAISSYYLIATSEASANLARFDGIRYGYSTFDLRQSDFVALTRGAYFGEEVKKRIMLGTFALSAGYADAYFKKAQLARLKIAQDFKEIFTECHILMTPVAPTHAPKLGENSTDPLKMYLSDVFTTPVNLAGLPALSAPIKVATGQLPCGFQLIAPPLMEEEILAAAHFYERDMFPHLFKAVEI